MSNLQLGLIVAGVLLVIGVVIFNAWQERRLRRRLDKSFPPIERGAGEAPPPATRVEPTLRPMDEDAPVESTPRAPPAGAAPAFRPGVEPDEAFAPPMQVIEHADVETVADEEEQAPAVAESADTAAVPMAEGRVAAQPDPDIESIVTMHARQPIPPSAIAPLLQGRFGKPVRWFARSADGAPWQRLAADSPGTFTEFVGCLLLADRNGSVSRAQIDTFVRAVRDVANGASATIAAPDSAAEVGRAEMLDRLCADVDVQIGLTVLKPESAAIAGTRLRGVAEAAGFRLAAGGRFEYVHEETGNVEYTLTNLRSEPFTAESLRLTATHGVVFVLDVPRVADPPRTFDRMKLAAKRMAKTLHAEVVDDNRRPLDDAAMAAIRAQVDAAAQALARVHIEPGSARALALFGA